jgi:hypothetical protein
MERLRIVCSGFLIRHPVGGHVWHHFQYLIGLRRLGHRVSYFEDYGWRQSCYDLGRHRMTSDPTYGIARFREWLRRYELDDRWCYLSEDGTEYGMSRTHLAERCRESDLYVNFGSLNWIPELEECRRRVLVDTDPVFTQIGALGTGEALSGYHVRFTYGENVHQPGCDMPTAGCTWLATRQPIVLDQWRVERGDPAAPFTTVTNWSPLPDCRHQGRVYGNKDREFEPFFTLPHDTGERMEIAVGGEYDRNTVSERFSRGGWHMADATTISRDPWTYQRYLRSSRAEFSVAKHGYVVTRCGWFSDRSAAYLASGRPVVVQNTGFSEWLPTGNGLLAFNTREEAIAGLNDVNARYEFHCRAARALAEEYFDARLVLSSLIDRAMTRSAD